MPDQKTDTFLQKAVLLAFLILSFYHLGLAVMLHNVIYVAFDKVHEHYGAFMEVFAAKIGPLYYGPTLAMLLAAVALLWQRPTSWPKRAVWSLVGLSAIITLNVDHMVASLHERLEKGFSQEVFEQLNWHSLWFDIVPSTLLVVLALALLSSTLRMVPWLKRWLYIALFFLADYTAGTSFGEGLLNYPLWYTIGPKDWMAVRQTMINDHFFWIFLLPGFLPLFLTIAFFWLRPMGISIWLAVLQWSAYLWILFITATYFVPHIQIPLTDIGYNGPLILEVIRNEVLYRTLPGLLIFVLPAFMFLKINSEKT